MTSAIKNSNSDFIINLLLNSTFKFKISLISFICAKIISLFTIILILYQHIFAPYFLIAYAALIFNSILFGVLNLND